MVAIEHDTTGVPMLPNGEDLAPILWRGRQWAVTEFGIEALKGTYQIAFDDLLPSREWVWHMSQKRWVDIADFATAYAVALAFKNPLHREMVMVDYEHVIATA